MDLFDAIKSASKATGVFVHPYDGPGKSLMLSVSEKGSVYSMDQPYADGDEHFFEALAVELEAAYLKAEVIENNHWAFSLLRGGILLDRFDSCPEYFSAARDEAMVRSFEGRPEVLAEVWGIGVNEIERYFRCWGRFSDLEGFKITLTGRAYESDQCEYGDYFQIYDFLSKLGFAENWRYQFAVKVPSRRYGKDSFFKEDYSSLDINQVVEDPRQGGLFG
ncbi:hypothetical protein [Cerasicoccus fimbriatus]|uniref:hypothetical protein n=1 Tax=Cerasicoccus fimbriatus TaxID=3014554 RepID=UPI0022B36EE7|nr:hypothetical protein [Cerasicoccus sp. TK19100]